MRPYWDCWPVEFCLHLCGHNWSIFLYLNRICIELLFTPQCHGQTIAHFNATYRNIVGRNLFGAFGHSVATCCDMLSIENRTRAHARAQHCCTNLAKRVQHHATFANVAWKVWPFSNLSQQHATCCNTSQHRGQTRATCCGQQCCDMLRWNVRSFGRGTEE